ncbi:hypothetical protein BCF58_0967 [Chryseobacterium defluvii]|uniref:Uncharacterized protein n=1 Tax=Chryseobacterium defluvii TaxID=160396 RepID=A0A495SNC9_9FLAO|nr:hypothetical protein BCF58_0967 [Chryseobacterium defluvii]
MITNKTTLKNIPDYKKIFIHILEKKYPERLKEFEFILKKKHFSELDVIFINERIFGANNRLKTDHNQKFRSYSKHVIQYILEYQQRNNLNNIQLARHFKLSRNTVTRWKKLDNLIKNAK